MDANGMTAAEQLVVVSNTVYGHRGMVAFPQYETLLLEKTPLALQPASNRARLETSTTRLSFSL
jgi:hypothetical protein